MIYLKKTPSKLSAENEKKGRVRKTRLSLMYIPGGGQKRQFENLKLFLYEKPKTNLEKEHNKETLNLAETIKAKRLLDYQATGLGVVSKIRSQIGFLAFFKKMVDDKYESIGNHGNWLSTYQHLNTFMKGKDIPIGQIEERFLESFKEYLMTCKTRKGKCSSKLSQNSILSYFCKVKACLREAFMKKMITENPALRVKPVKAGDPHRQFLTFEELQLLVNTHCELDLLKRAFLFSSLTGLRWSDVKALTWDKIKHSVEDGWSIEYTQKKTKCAEMLPISEQAIKFLGENNGSGDPIFNDLDYSAWNNLKLREWVLQAGITKKITFHCARHSFATLQLSMNTDIYTVSKLLGHRHLKTTEIYAKVIDKKKIEAARRIPEFL